MRLGGIAPVPRRMLRDGRRCTSSSEEASNSCATSDPGGRTQAAARQQRGKDPQHVSLQANKQEVMTIKYRPDIDGLRAIAVLAVVFYHYGIGAMHGGFVGVDVFFVISGYLITGIIHKEIEQGKFTFAAFYERRIRRIFPALFVVLAATLAVGCWLLLPSDLLRLGNAALATLVFGSNVLFWRQSGYFDTSAEYNPLLHTWSLAVEEQFYIGLPILLILLQRFAKGRVKLVLIVGAVLSFSLCVGLQTLRPAATFFLSPFRAWELLLGGWLAVGGVPPIRSTRVRVPVSVAALALLLWSLWWIQAGPAFPGWQAALPVIATAVLLHAGAQGSSWVQRLLSLKPLVFVGLISYSLYLWHWPLFVVVRYHNGMVPLAPSVSLLLCGVAILLAAASYRWVETPLRRRRKGAVSGARKKVFVAAAVTSVLLVAASFASRLHNGWQSRFSSEVVAYDEARHPVIPYKECNGRVPDFKSMECRIGVKDVSPRILLWGDSHAMAWAPGLDVVLREKGASGILAVMTTCPPLLGVHNPVNIGCHDDNNRLLAQMQGHRFDAIIMVAYWSRYSDPGGKYTLFDDQGRSGNPDVFQPALDRTLAMIRPYAKRIILIGPTPGAPGDIPFRMALASRGLAPVPAEIPLPMNRSFWTVAEKYSSDMQVEFVDTSKCFCGPDSCRYENDESQLLYRDGDHLSLAGSMFMADCVNKGLIKWGL